MSGLLSATHRTAFVTGASTGLGLAFARMLLAEGVRVWGTSRTVSRLEPLISEYGDAFQAIPLELADSDGAEAAFEAADEAASGLDIVVNNAGYSVFGAFHEVEFDAWKEQLEAMLLTTARLSQAAVRSMLRRRRGILVNVSSLAAEFPIPYQAAYNMAKAGLTALSESLMVEVAGTGVAVIDLRPGDFRTEFETSVRRPAGSDSPREAKAWAAFARMMRSGPPPEEAAQALRKALLRGRSGTVRCGSTFQSVVAPFLARFGSLKLKRGVQSRYFDVS